MHPTDLNNTNESLMYTNTVGITHLETLSPAGDNFN
jgi:hypothetical protein